MSPPQETTNALRSALLSSRALVGIEDLPSTSHLEQQFRRLEPPRKAGVQVFEPLNHNLDAEGIHVAECAAAKRGKADSKYRSNVAITRRANDSIAQASRGFVEHRQHRPLLNLYGRHL